MVNSASLIRHYKIRFFVRDILLYLFLICCSIVSFGQNINTNCLNFDDNLNNFVRLDNPVRVYSLGDFTIEFWLRAGELGAYDFRNQWWEGDGLIDADYPGGFSLTPYDDFGVSLWNNKIAFGVGSANGSDVTIFSDALISIGTWVHVAATYKSSNGEMKLYVNGNLQSQNGYSITGGNKGSSSYMSIGRIDHNQSGSYFNGDIDEVRIWNVVRSGTQIAAYKDKQITGQASGLVLSYHFNQGTAGGCNSWWCWPIFSPYPSELTTLINDSGVTAPSPYSNTGTLNNFSLSGTTSNWVSASSLTLPVSWLTFAGKQVHGDVELNWSTASEQNNSHYEIQRSADAINFISIGRADAATNPNVTNHYLFLDQSPLIGTSYYRLKQLDLDGKFSYSSVIQINGVDAKEFSAFVNTASRTLQVRIPQSVSSVCLLNLYDATGRLIAKKQLLPGRNDIDISQSGSVMYFVQIVSGNSVVYITQIVN